MNPSSRSFLVFALITRVYPEQFSQSAQEFKGDMQRCTMGLSKHYRVYRLASCIGV